MSAAAAQTAMLARIGEYPLHATAAQIGPENFSAMGLPARTQSAQILQVIDADALAAMLSAKTPGEMLVDYDHLSSDLTQKTEAAGWLDTNTLQVKDGALYGDITWTRPEEIQSRRYRYLSPEFATGATLHYLGKNRFRVTKLTGLALTNRPNIKNLAALNREKSAFKGGANADSTIATDFLPEAPANHPQNANTGNSTPPPPAKNAHTPSLQKISGTTPEKPTPKSAKNMDITKLAELLGLKPDAGEEEVFAAINALTPRAGRGIALRGGSNGVVISATTAPAPAARRGETKEKLGFLQPILTTTKQGKPAWSVTVGFINNSMDITLYPSGAKLGENPETGEPSNDPQDWAQEITGDGDIYLSCEAIPNEDSDELLPVKFGNYEINFDQYTPDSTEEKGYHFLGQIVHFQGASEPTLFISGDRSLRCTCTGEIWNFWST